MRKPKFDFGDIVIPTLKAFTAGVFDWNKRTTLVGVVVYCQGLETVVVLKGRRRTTQYHTSFWARP